VWYDVTDRCGTELDDVTDWCGMTYDIMDLCGMELDDVTDWCGVTWTGAVRNWMTSRTGVV